MQGFRILVVNNAPTFASTVTVYANIAVGDVKGWGAGDLQTLRAFHVAPGGDHTDPLAQKAIVGWKVRFGTMLLDEAGPRDAWWNWKIHMPAALMYNLMDDKYNWYYHTEPQPYMNDRVMYWPRGRVLGGSSSLNAMVYIRVHALDYDRWAFKEGSVCVPPAFAPSTGPWSLFRMVSLRR